MKKFVFALFMALTASTGYAQEVYSSSGKPLDETRKNTENEEAKGFNPNNLIFGGGFTLGMGGGITNIGIAPVLGYRITDKFSAGIGLGYEYLSVKFYNAYTDKNGIRRDYTQKTSIYSANLWARYLIWDNIFVHVEPGMIMWSKVNNVYYDPTNDKVIEDVNKNLLVPRLLLGGGLRQPISDRVSFVMMGLYDVIQDPNSPYNGLDIRFGIMAGF